MFKKIFDFFSKKEKVELPQDDSIESAKIRLKNPINIKYRGTSWSIDKEEALQRAIDVLNVSAHEYREEIKKEKIKEQNQFSDFLNSGKINE